MDKFNRDVCEVCGNPIVDTDKLPPELQEKVYRPRDHEAIDVEVTLPSNDGFEKSEF